MRYSRLDEAIQAEIIPTLGEYVGDYDVEAIAQEVFEYRVDVNIRGEEVVTTAGFEQVATGDDFWAIVDKHEKR